MDGVYTRAPDGHAAGDATANANAANAADADDDDAFSFSPASVQSPGKKRRKRVLN